MQKVFRRVLSTLAFLLIAFSLTSQHLAAYRLFDKNGVETDFGTMVNETSQTQVVLFGELHNNPISHWLQLELTMALHAEKQSDLVLGMEMFEADDQLKIDEYFSGLIAQRNFKQEARLWSNYNTDYEPLLEFARENGLKLIATNVPRRYASLVNRQGFEGLDSLSMKAQMYIAPAPVPYDPELPGYKAMLEMTGMPAHTKENFPKAQAIKDATMAHFIVKNLGETNTFIHYHGAFHSDNYDGIVWYLRQYSPDIRLVTVSTVEQSQTEKLDEDNLGVADFIIVVPDTMTKTY
jgi:uncharacterized iron-regulated protein